MALGFNADEVYEMAERIEVNGEKFYRRASKLSKDDKVKALFDDLAYKEGIHKKIVMQLREALPAEASRADAFDPDDEAGAYLAAVADSHVFAVYEDPAELLPEDVTPIQALKVALEGNASGVVELAPYKETVIGQNAGTDRISVKWMNVWTGTRENLRSTVDLSPR